jgi:hypothetical protein
MAWVHVGPHKINTALVCYVEQEGDTVRIYFTGEWEGNPLDLHFDEARAFWKHIKAEDVMMLGRDKGSAAVLPKAGSGGSSAKPMYDIDLGEEKSEAPKPPAKPMSPQPHRHADHRKH